MKKKEISCKHCMGPHYVTFCYFAPKKAIKVNKRIKPIGRRGLLYKNWREEVAIPYLNAKYGYKCSVCGSEKNLDVAHVKGRGAYPQLSMVLDNVVWKCRTCHREEHNGSYKKDT